MGIQVQPNCCDPHSIYLYDSTNGFRKRDTSRRDSQGRSKLLWRETPALNGGVSPSGFWGLYGNRGEKLLYYYGTISSASHIVRMKPDQSERAISSALSAPLGCIAVDHPQGTLYAATTEGAVASGPQTTPSRIVYGGLDGSGLTTMVTISTSDRILANRSNDRSGFIYSRSADAVFFTKGVYTTNTASTLTRCTITKVTRSGTETEIVQLSKVATDNESLRSVAYDSEREQLYFSHLLSSVQRLYRCDIDGSNVTQLLEVSSLTTLIDGLQFDVPGRRLLYARTRFSPTRTAIWERDVDGAYDRELISPTVLQGAVGLFFRAGTGFISPIDETWR